MLTWMEKRKLQELLQYLNEEELMEYPHYQTPQKKKRSTLDVSQRLRDEQGRFLPFNYQIMEESESILDESELLRKLKIEPIKGSYNSFSVDEKTRRDWSGNIYLLCLLGVLIITYLS